MFYRTLFVLMICLPYLCGGQLRLSNLEKQIEIPEGRYLSCYLNHYKATDTMYRLVKGNLFSVSKDSFCVVQGQSAVYRERYSLHRDLSKEDVVFINEQTPSPICIAKKDLFYLASYKSNRSYKLRNGFLGVGYWMIGLGQIPILASVFVKPKSKRRQVFWSGVLSIGVGGAVMLLATKKRNSFTTKKSKGPWNID